MLVDTAKAEDSSNTSPGDHCWAPSTRFPLTDPLHMVMRKYNQCEHVVLPTLNRLEFVGETAAWLSYMFSPHRTLVVTKHSNATHDDAWETDTLITKSGEDKAVSQVIYSHCSYNTDSLGKASQYSILRLILLLFYIFFKRF